MQNGGDGAIERHQVLPSRIRPVPESIPFRAPQEGQGIWAVVPFQPGVGEGGTSFIGAMACAAWLARRPMPR